MPIISSGVHETLSEFMRLGLGWNWHTAIRSMALTLDELVYEPNAPPEVRRSDIQVRFHLMSLNPSRRDLAVLLADRAARIQQAALPKAEDLLRGASQDPGRAASEVEDFTVFVHGLAELSTILAQLPTFPSRARPEEGVPAACRREFEEAAAAILRDGIAFREVVRDALEPYSPELRSQIEQALRLVREGMQEIGVERQEMLRDARGLLSAVLDNPDAMTDPVLWFYQGWLSWKRDLAPESVRHAFFQACLGSSARKDVVYWLSCRHLAAIQCSIEAFDSAYTSAGHALRVRQDAPTLLEFARYATLAGRQREASGAILRCLDLSPLAAIDLFAGEEFAA